MGALVKGKWTEESDKLFQKGRFIRQASSYDGPLPDAVINSICSAEGRYILVASLSCPWSHRVALVRAVKNLASSLPLVVAKGPRLQGYAIEEDTIPGLKGHGIRHLHQLYTLSDPVCSGRSTVPLLWDSQDMKIICNDSAQMMRSLDRVQSDLNVTLTPPPQLHRINSLNTRIHSGLGNAVYRAGLARSQAAYEDAVNHVFSTLDFLDEELRQSRYLCGDLLTESDLQLFTTLVRFDAVYASHFRCTRKRLTDYPALWPYARDLHSLPGISGTVDFPAILDGYYSNDGDHNPYGIIAELPEINWDATHNREALGTTKIWHREDGPICFQ